MPLVSVLMPVYNRERLVVDAIRSIQSQTFEDWELIILDDASTDSTLDVCRRFESEDPRIRVIASEQNLGIGHSRNRLLSEATGKYVAIHDSDDISVEERFRMEVEFLESVSEVGVVSGICEWIDMDGRVLWYYPILLKNGDQYPREKKQLIKYLYAGCEIAHSACMFRRSLLDGPEPYGNFNGPADWYFFVQMAHKTKFWGLHAVLVRMRRGKNHQYISQAPGRQALQVSKKIYKQYRNNPDSPVDFDAYRGSVSRILIAHALYFRGWKGFRYLLWAMCYDPKRARKYLSELWPKEVDEHRWLHA
jgi:glycosyltransferase involved in cell wall biosynthesis